MKEGVGESYTDHNCLSMQKYFGKITIYVFVDKKIQKEALLGGSGGKEGGVSGSLYSSTWNYDQFVLICKKIHQEKVKRKIMTAQKH